MRANYTRYLHVATNGDLPRTIFPMPSRQLTTFNEGDLVPIYCQEVIPNSTWEHPTRAFIRGSTPIFPVMDDAWCETFYFFCPNRLVWSHWRAFLGENENSAWDYDLPEYTIPQMNFKSSSAESWTGELMDYFNIGACSYTKQIDSNNVLTDNDITDSTYNDTLGKISVSALPFRAYNLIYNHYFRDENVVAPVPVNTGDEDENYWTFDDLPVYRHYKVRKVSRFHDYFSSALPAPQKGSASYLPFPDFVPVITSETYNNFESGIPLYFGDGFGNSTGYGNLYLNNNGKLVVDRDGTTGPDVQSAVPINLVANFRNIGTTVEGLRQAIAVQRILELKARGGSRYVEIINSFFDCRVPDATMQIPEYLGGTKFKLSQQQVVQTSSTDNVSPLGTVSAVSKSTDENLDFRKSFTEHGYIIGLATIRVNRTYQQGIERMWKRKDFYDFYLPQLANLGDQPIYNYELYATGTDKDNEIFGYNEAQATYRYKPSNVSGMFRRDNNFGNYLDAYHYADFYSAQPYLSKDWIEEGTENIDKTLAVEADKNHQFLCDFYFDTVATLPIPYNSIPTIEARF